MACSLLLKQFLLLLWKNFILQIRRPVSTVFELLLPSLALVLLVGLRLGNVLSTTDNCFSTFEPDGLNLPNATNGMPYNIYFTPDNAQTNDIISRVVERLAVPMETLGFDSEATMVESLAALVSSANGSANGSMQTCFAPGAGVVFDRLDGGNVEYTLRLRQPSGSWDTNTRGDTLQTGPRTSNPYLEEGFLHLENAIGLSIIEFYANKTINLQISVEQFPYPPYSEDVFFTALSSNFALLIVMAFIFSAGFFVKELVVEKESRIRETMLMMGLKQWVLWSTWYLKQFLFLLIPVLVVCILLKAGQIFPRTDFLLLLIYVIVFILSMISFCFFVSVWFNTGRLGLAMGFTVYYLTFVPFYLVQVLGYERLGFGGKMGMCVLSNTCMSLGLEIITRLEQRMEGLQWSNVATPLTADDPFNMGWVFFWLLLEIVVYMVIAWYVNGVKPGPYGIRQPFYFPFLPSYWIGHKAKIEEPAVSPTDDNTDSANHEVVTDNWEIGISIKNLTKIFGHSFFAKLFSKEGKPVKKAVDNVSLKIYKGQITALLGHNGAGKTTTMSMLTGLFSPTSGTATINGYSILTDIDKIRTSLGICPQHNILFDRLTLSEHLAFFLRLKGVFDRKRVREEVKSMVEDIQLMEKKDTQASKLSGGMKRKLSVAIALIGGSEVVILDEPTSGMDPYARRSTWDLLAKHKPGRTMLLTTHHMDEADLLGDRIAIMAEGKLRCSGSSLFLKSKYGVGYHLTLVKDDSCDPSRVERAVKSVVSKAEQSTNVGAELSYVLPSSATASFPELFDKLEAEKVALGISSFGISVTTMEEVFIKVGEGVEDERLQQSARSTATAKILNDNDTTIENLESITDTAIIEGEESGSASAKKVGHKREHLRYTFTPNTGLYLRFQQIWAMFLKKFFVSIRAYGFLISQLVLPAFFIILANVLAISIPSSGGQEPRRALTLENSALFVDNLTLFYAQFDNISIDNTSEPFLLSELTSSEFGARSVFNLTEGAQQIRKNVDDRNFTVTDCCGYRFQILDQYCASRPVQEIMDTCNEQDDFGYNTCSECLSCCESITTGLASCSNPMSLMFSSSICPTSPKLSSSSIQEVRLSGSLETDNVYITEHLLRTFSGVAGRPEFFFRSFQAGFSVNLREPSNSVCGCNRTSEDIQDFMSSINTCNSLLCPVDQQTVGAVFPNQERQMEATVWYNNQPSHMSAAALNIFHNFLLRSEMKNRSLSIAVNNHPLPRNASEQVNNAVSGGDFAIGFIVGFFVVFAFASMISSFVVVPVEEKEKKVKHLQFLSGIHPSSYWLASYAWDILNTLIPIVLTIIIFAAFQVDAFSSSQVLGAIFILLLLSVWAGIPVSYMFSFLFSNSLTASAIVNLFFIFSALLPQTLVFVLQFFTTDGERSANILHYVSLIIPTYGLSSAFIDLVVNENLRATCAQFPDLTKEQCLSFVPFSSNFVDNPLSLERPGIGGTLLYLFFEGFVYFSLTLLIQNKFFIPQLKTLLKKDEVNDQTSVPLLKGQDSDVNAEATRVLSGATDGDDAIIMKNLVKVYSSQLSGCTVKPAKWAVNGINLAIPSGECFGLLGVNGAGKTTTFGMLTGEFPITSGRAVIDGFDVSTNLRNVQQRIGYCPQFDALLELLTGRELLTLFARLRGVPEKQIKEVVEIEITRMDLKKHADKRSAKYSGGNKRKLCTAIALIGNPPIVLLDEPTTGLDPTTKRYLWDVLTGIIQEGRSIVLTSHSMEECEALCTRLAIMVNGSFRCLGSVQHLKNKFSSGLTLQAKVNLSPQTEEPTSVLTSPRRRSSRRRDRSGSHGYSSVSEEPNVESQSAPAETVQLGSGSGSPSRTVSGPYDATPLHAFIHDAFPGAVLLEEHQGFVSYQLPSGNLSWSSTFREIETNKECLGIVDYSVSQTTLDQVFINFAKEQKDE